MKAFMLVGDCAADQSNSGISYLPTTRSLFSAAEEKDEILSRYPAYTMVYFWGNYFDLCSMWLRNGKKESPEELFEIIR